MFRRQWLFFYLVQFCHTAACKLTSVSTIINPDITFPV